MSLIEESIALTPHKITAQPPPDNEDAWLLEVAGIQLLYEATLQDLLCTKNYTVYHLLWEHNALLQERCVELLFIGFC
jgi:hypothetical protein